MKDDIDQKLINLLINRCDLYEKSTSITIKWNFSTEKLIEWHESGVNLDDMVNTPIAFFLQYQGTECMQYAQSWDKAFKENQEWNVQRINSNDEIHSFCNLAGHNNYTMELCDSI